MIMFTSAKDLEVSTFEVNIRSLPWIRNSEHETTPLGRVKQHNRGILGGLLSGHLHAQKILPKYAGGLLEKARHGLCSNVSGTYKKAEGTDQSSQARASCDEDRSNRPVQQSEGWQVRGVMRAHEMFLRKPRAVPRVHCECRRSSTAGFA